MAPIARTFQDILTAPQGRSPQKIRFLVIFPVEISAFTGIDKIHKSGKITFPCQIRDKIIMAISGKL